jgi:hypothetical protein
MDKNNITPEGLGSFVDAATTLQHKSRWNHETVEAKHIHMQVRNHLLP